MTLRQLAKRLNDIVDNNDRQGWSYRNDKLPVGIEVRRGGRKHSHYYRVEYASQCQVDAYGTDYGATILVDEKTLNKPRRLAAPSWANIGRKEGSTGRRRT